MATRAARLACHSCSHQERITLVCCPLPVGQDCLAQLKYRVYPRPSATTRHVADGGHPAVPREGELADNPYGCQEA